MADFPTRAYLSYRMLNRDRQARDRLKAICDAQGIELVYAESETKQGDSLIKFMDDLSSARFVFVFLSPEYFQSSYTLYELVKINEWVELDHRFIIPLRLTENMNIYQWTEAKSYFDSNVAIRDGLEHLFNSTNEDHAAIWKRIDEAWRTIIFPHLKRLNVTLEAANVEQSLTDLALQTRTTIAEAIAQSTKSLQKAVIQGVTSILELKRLDNAVFAREMNSNEDIPSIAKKLVLETEVGDAVAILTRVVEEQRNFLDKESMEWKKCFYDAEQVCGWLLINSVEPTWWFHHEINLKKLAEQGVIGNFVLDDPAYVEVVISRSLLQHARYTLNKQNRAKPAGEKYDVMALFDAVSNGAQMDQLLEGMYKDLYKNPSSLPDKQDLLDAIVTRVNVHYKTRKEKPIYYLVTQDSLKAFESCFQKVQERVKGRLQFICCDKSVGSPGNGACTEDQTQLLDQVAYLISLET